MRWLMERQQVRRDGVAEGLRQAQEQIDAANRAAAQECADAMAFFAAMTEELLAAEARADRAEEALRRAQEARS